MGKTLSRAGAIALIVGVVGLSSACGRNPPETSETESLSVELKSLEASSEAPETVADVDDPWLRPGQVTEWTGDLDGMIERGFIRLLTPANRTHYFVDGARERGISAEAANALEEMLNKQLGEPDAVRVVVIPVRRDQLLPAHRS